MIKNRKFLIVLQIINLGTGTFILVLAYFIVRIVFNAELLALFSRKLWIFDGVIILLFLWNLRFLYVCIAKPFLSLMDYYGLRWRDGTRESPSVGKENLFSTLFSTIQKEMNKNRSDIQSYSQQVALRASMIRELKQEYEKKVYDLFTLFDVAKELNSTLNERKISQTMLLTCMGQMGISFALVYQLEEYLDFQLFIRDARGIDIINREQYQLDISGSFVKHLLSVGKGILFQQLHKEFENDHDFQKLQELNVSLLIPFIDKKEIRVLLAVGPKVTGESFNKDDIEFLSIMTNLGGLALENAKLYTMAITDGLTKLYLQRYFILKAEEEIKRSKRYKQPLSMLMIDVDDFKKINDTYGHLEGNKILVGIAESLIKGTRETDFPARYGGEEFAILMPMTGKDAAQIVAERVRQMIEKKEFIIREKPFHVTVSIGVAAYPADGETVNHIIDCADSRLYKAKSSGKNQVKVA